MILFYKVKKVSHLNVDRGCALPTFRKTFGDRVFDPSELKHHQVNYKYLEQLKQKVRDSYRTDHGKQARKFKVKEISKRIDVLYLHAVHNARICKIEAATGLKYTTILNMVEIYDKSGSLRQYLQKWQKVNILRHRYSHLHAQKQYRKFRLK